MMAKVKDYFEYLAMSKTKHGPSDEVLLGIPSVLLRKKAHIDRKLRTNCEEDVTISFNY